MCQRDELKYAQNAQRTNRAPPAIIVGKSPQHVISSAPYCRTARWVLIAFFSYVRSLAVGSAIQISAGTQFVVEPVRYYCNSSQDFRQIMLQDSLPNLSGLKL